jgi:O-antigen/teichoic acid export membrane protein
MALALLPVLSLAFLVSGLTAYPTYACKLSSRTDLLLMSIAVAAAINLALNVILIPRYGAFGAAFSCLLACSIRLVMLTIIARHLFPLPIPEPVTVLAGILGTAAMALWLWPFYNSTDRVAESYIIPGAVIIYAGVCLLVMHLNGRSLKETFFTQS